MRKGKLIGYKKFKAKSGKVFDVISVVRPFKDEENTISSSGEEAVSFFLPDDLFGSVTPDDVGKEIVFRTRFYNKSEFLVDVSVSK